MKTLMKFGSHQHILKSELKPQRCTKFINYVVFQQMTIFFETNLEASYDGAGEMISTKNPLNEQIWPSHLKLVFFLLIKLRPKTMNNDILCFLTFKCLTPNYFKYILCICSVNIAILQKYCAVSDRPVFACFYLNETKIETYIITF